ncbi:putative ATP-dependent RNA helicase DHX57 [Aulostomus maculatus]
MGMQLSVLLSTPGQGQGGTGWDRDGSQGWEGFDEDSHSREAECPLSTKQYPEKQEINIRPPQRFWMSRENQEELTKLQQDLQTLNIDEFGSDYSVEKVGNEGQFRATNDEPAEISESDPEEPVISPFILDKLCRYGFDRERSKRALKSGGGEFEAVLEQLLLQVFTERYGQNSVSNGSMEVVTMTECLSQRQEEAMMLARIYGIRFSQDIASGVWTVKLDLWFLSYRAVNTRGVCRFYLKGKHCRFGGRCKFGHQLPTKGRAWGSSPDLNVHSQPWISSSCPPEYELVIRFPKRNRYPFQAPLVAFNTNDESVGAAGRLSVTEKLFGTALVAAHNGEPVVHTLITLCQDQATMKGLLAISYHKYSTSPPVVVVPPPFVSNPRKDTMTKPCFKMDSVLKENAKLCQAFQRKQSSAYFRSMLELRKRLPAWNEKDTILDLLEQSHVLVITGITGCGKTTQIPQYILDASLNGPADRVANIICTQPRRISAVSVAQRVAQERAESLGNSVGYQIRLESVRTCSTRLLYCTTGVLLRRLENKADLKGITHVIVDEVHERMEESDFLLLVLKDLITERPDLKVILMSATLNTKLFSKYFDNCPIIHILGHTFPVDEFFLEDVIDKTGYVSQDGSPYMRSWRRNSTHSRGGEAQLWDTVDNLRDDEWNSTSSRNNDFVEDSIPDQLLSLEELTVRYQDTKRSVLETIAAMDLDKINMDLVEHLLQWILEGKHSYPPGAVLVFMPGLAEIKTLYEQLQSSRLFNNSNTRYVVYPLHSTLTTEEQQAVFSRPPEDVTKIIISTNIAETSVTIDDVVYVIDCGKMKEKRYDAARSMESLEDSWVSRASSLQRKGRAGRVASGVCFHLFTSHHFKHQLAEQQLPEIQRVPLEQLCLRVKNLDVFSNQTLASVFSRLIEPPATGGLDAATQHLEDLGALTADEKLTPLGYHLASLPVDVRIGKLVLFGAIFGCLDPALTIAASLALKSPFVSPWDKRQEANDRKLGFARANSDHLTLLQAYKEYCCMAKNGNRAAYLYCRENFLSLRGLQGIAGLKRQFAELLSDIGFIKRGLKARNIERMCFAGSDGILEATGMEANVNADNISLISAILCASHYPNVVQVQTPDPLSTKVKDFRFLTKNDGYVHLHPSSVNFGVCHDSSPFLIYYEKVKTSRVFIRDCSPVSAYALMLFGGGKMNVELQHGQRFISLDDGWINFAAPSYQVAQLIQTLRFELDHLLEDKIRKPSMDLSSCPRGSRILNTVVQLISTQ